MARYVAQRLLHTVVVLLGVALLTFALIHLTPGDPVLVMLGQDATPAELERLRHLLGLDQPLHVQFVQYLGRLVTGQMGDSIFQHQPVTRLIGDRLPATVELTVAAMVIAITIGLTTGVISALVPYSLFDVLAMFVALSGVAMPVFWLGMLGILLFALQLGWLPSFGRGEPAKLRVGKDGIALLFVGSTPQGQGHQTIAAQVAADRLGWQIDKIHVTAGDTEHVPFALLTAGSRSAVMVGNATAKAATAMRKKLLERAGEILEADVHDLVLEDGIIEVRGAPTKRVPATDVVPEEGLEVFESFDPGRPLTFSSSCHAAVVSVDPETGHVEVVRYVIVHDTGKAINTRLVEGQMHGGYAHGLGYALYESAAYESRV